MDDNTRAVIMVIISSGTTVGVAMLKMRPTKKGKFVDEDEEEDPSEDTSHHQRTTSQMEESEDGDDDEPTPLDHLEVDPATGKVTDTSEQSGES